MTKLFHAFWLALILGCSCISLPGQTVEPAIPDLLREASEKSDANWDQVSLRLQEYVYKWRRSRRSVDEKGRITNTEELIYELIRPASCRPGRCQPQAILLEKDGKPESAADIALEREKVSKKLVKLDEKPAPNERPKSNERHWLRFAISSGGTLFGRGVLARLDGQDIIQRCTFTDARPETVRDRKATSLRFTCPKELNYAAESWFISGLSGRIWVDDKDKVIFRIAAGADDEALRRENNLRKSVPLISDMIRTKEGLWVLHYGRINGIDFPLVFGGKLRHDLQIENFDHRHSETEVTDVQVAPKKN